MIENLISLNLYVAILGTEFTILMYLCGRDQIISEFGTHLFFTG